MHHQPERLIFTRKPMIPDSTIPPVPRQIASQVLIAGGSINDAILAK